MSMENGQWLPKELPGRRGLSVGCAGKSEDNELVEVITVDWDWGKLSRVRM